MAQEQRWAIMENGRPRFAQTVEKIDGKWVANPSKAQKRKAGFKPYADVIPMEPLEEGYHWEKNGWDASGDSIIQLYHVVKDDPPPPRRFSKRKVVKALKKIGVWDQIKQWIIDNDLYDEYQTSQDFAEGDEDLDRGKTALQTALGWTDEEVEAVLAASVI